MPRFLSAPPLVNVTPSTITVREGEEVVIECTADGLGELTIDWSLLANGSGLPPGVGVEKRGTKQLFIPEANRSHTGIYTCSVSNVAGTSRADVTVTVQCK